jgi:hypothetical protein
VSGPAGREPGRKVIRRIRGGDLLRVMWKPPGKAQGRCLACDLAPVGTTQHNLSRELMRHTRRTGHVTRFAAVEVVEYRPAPASSDRSEHP